MNKIIIEPQPAEQRIERLEQVRQDFVANVSHELRTPLTVIHGYLDALLSKGNQDSVSVPKSILDSLFSQTTRMQHIIEDLLLLASIESNILPNDKKTAVPVARLIQNIIEDAKVLSQGNHIFDTYIHSDLTLPGVEKELYSLFSNIIFNAVKYTPPKGKITISWQLKNKQKIFSVKDNGLGIPKEHLPRITERFYRIDKARSREAGGTGLGLAIVKHVLFRHKGTLEIRSKEHIGSEFICYFFD